MLDKILALSKRLQLLIDFSGDFWLGLFSLLVLLRIALVLRGYRPLTMAEATAYSFAISAFAASKIGGPRI